MAHELTRLTSQLYNTPQLITQTSFESVLDYLEARNRGSYVAESREDREERESRGRYNYNEEYQVATMAVEGVTSYKPVTLFGMDCGGFSYQQWKEDFTYLAESGVKTVAFLQDSGGGEAHGLFDAADYVRSVADEYGIHLISMVDGLSASASYGISSIADEIILTKGSQVGSIGCVVRLMDDSKAMEEAGLKRVFITSATSKVPYSEDGTFREDFLKDIQSSVDIMGANFVSFVAENRGISEEQVRSTQARVFLEEEAIELGLADRVMDIESFYTYLADISQQQLEGTMKNKLFKSNQEELSVTDHTQELATLQTQNQELSTQLADFAERFTALEATVGEKDAELAKAAEQLAKMEEDKEATKAAMRKEKLASVLPEDKVDGMAASLASLEDDAFATVLENLGTQHKAAAESDLFKEMGSDFEAENQDDKEELSSTDKALMERFPELLQTLKNS